MEGVNLLIEKYKRDNNLSSYIEAVCDFAAEFEIEVEEIVDNLDVNMKKQVQIEFIKKNYFPDVKIEGSMDDFFEENDI